MRSGLTELVRSVSTDWGFLFAFCIISVVESPSPPLFCISCISVSFHPAVSLAYGLSVCLSVCLSVWRCCNMAKRLKHQDDFMVPICSITIVRPVSCSWMTALCSWLQLNCSKNSPWALNLNLNYYISRAEYNYNIWQLWHVNSPRNFWCIWMLLGIQRFLKFTYSNVLKCFQNVLPSLHNTKE